VLGGRQGVREVVGNRTPPTTHSGDGGRQPSHQDPLPPAIPQEQSEGMDPVKRIITTALVAVIAVLALASVASADVAIDDNGVGFVGKGDVQTALGLNDEAMQSLFQSTSGVHFLMRKVTTYDNEWECSDGSVHLYTTVVTSNRPVIATANTNNAGKLTSGWDLPGIFGTDHPTTVDNLTEPFGICNIHGSYVTGMRINDPQYSTFTSTLLVNGVNGWAPLPNTPTV
jgi:hypothetical protein